jgi:SAM-dependent methyltransferase
MDVVNSLCPLPQGDRMLELGCGNAFHSYLLAHRFRSVIASDLAERDARTHTIGLVQAQALARILELRNLRIIGASAEALPLADGSLDFVFSSNVLEHVPDRPRAIREIYRVLKPGGKCLTIVPAAMERVYNFPVSYVLVVQSILRGLRNHYGRRARSEGGSSEVLLPVMGEAGDGSTGFWRKARRFFRIHFPGFPFPKPHGEYRSSTEEFLAHRPGRWLDLFRDQGFHIEETFTSILAPHILGMAISPRCAYWVARAGWPLTRRLGGRRVFRSLGTSYGFLASRPDGDRA